jgi:hypothetical protein
MIKNCLTIVVFIVFSLVAFCQEEQLVINLPASSLPGSLTFENPKGSIKVTGYDGKVVLVNYAYRYAETERDAGEDGMKRIDQNNSDISAEVIGNEVLLLCRITGKTVDFDIKVPRDFSIKLKSLDNGKVEVINMNGVIEVENTSGDITLENIAGSAVLNSVYGKINAVFRSVDPDSPMMLTTFEGDINITLPSSSGALLKMKSEEGEILSDFDIKPVKRQQVVKNVENKKVYSLEDWSVGTINSGGPEYIFRTYNGNIYIKKK